MKTPLLALVFTTTLALAFGQTPVNPTRNTTTLVMGLDISNGIVAPAGPSRVRVPVGERVELTLPSTAPTAAIQWTKDNVAIPGATSTRYAIAFATATDAGVYRVTGFDSPMITTGISLDVVSEGHLGNTSSRVELTADGSNILGFVVGGIKPKTLLFRAVGATLRNFGVSSPAPQPQVRCFDAKGREFTFAHPAVVIDVNALFRSIGAFPIDSAELPKLSFDYGPFAPGAYTLVVSDAAKTGGTALVEVYEMPSP